MDYINKVENAISSIQKLDRTKGHYYEKLLFELSRIDQLPIIIYRLDKDNLFFRTRINNDSDFIRFKDLSYPDKEFVTTYARVNKPLQQMFYCSENRPTSFIELLNNRNGNVGDEITLTISCWQLVEPVDVVLIFNPSNLRNSKYYQMHGEGYDNFIKQTTEEFREGTNKIFEFIGSYFEKPISEDKYSYMLTTAYSNLVFTHDQVEGVIYPSVPFGGDGFNIAFFPKVIDDNRLRLLNVMKNIMEIGQTDDGNLNFIERSAEQGIIDYSTSTIKWK